MSYCQEESLPLSLETSFARNKGKLDFGNIMLEIPETFFQQLIIFITELHSSFQGNSTECDHYFFKALSGQQKFAIFFFYYYLNHLSYTSRALNCKHP